MNHLRQAWRQVANGSQGIHFVVLPKDAGGAHAALVEHHEGRTAAVYPPLSTQPEWTRDVMHALTAKGEAGFTVHDKMGDAPRSGFMVSMDPHNEEKIPLSDLRHNPDWVGDYFDRHASELRNPDTYIGAWVWQGMAFLDVSVHTNSADEARRLCLRYNQKGYYDLATGQTVLVDRRALAAAYAAIGEKLPSRRMYARNATHLGDQLRAEARTAAKFVFDVWYATSKDTLKEGETHAGVSRVAIDADDMTTARLLAEQMVAARGFEPTEVEFIEERYEE